MNKRLLVAMGAAVFAQMASAANFPPAEGGVVTLTEAGEYGSAIPGGTTKLVVDVGGEAVLSAASAGFEGTVEVKSGSTLRVTNVSALGNSAKTVVDVEDGGTFHPNVGSTGQFNLVFPFTVKIAGAGVGNGGAFKFTKTGDNIVDKLLTNLVLKADATIACANRWGVSFGVIDLQGHTLTRIGSDNFMFVSASMTPGTFVHTAGKVTFQTNGSKYHANQPSDPTNCVFRFDSGSTAEFWSSGYIVPYKVVFNGGKLSIGSGSGVPPYNCFGGPVEFLKGAIYLQPTAGKNLSVGFMGPLNVTTNAFELNGAKMPAGYQYTAYFGGPVTGSGNIYATWGTQIFFQGDSIGTVRPVMMDSEMEFNATNACFSMFRCANGGARWGAFHQARGSIGVNRWDQPRVGESANSFGAYTFDQGRMVISNTFYLGEKENSRGIFLQKGGSFELQRDLSKDDNQWAYYKVGGKNAISSFIQLGGTNDTRMNTSQAKHFSIGEDGATNDMTFVVSGKDTLFETDKFYVGNSNLTRVVMTLSDGATLKAKRFSVEEKRPAGSMVVLNVNGGTIYPSMGWGWNGLDYNTANFLKRSPDRVVVGEKGLVMDTSECSNEKGGFAESSCPYQFSAPEGRGIATISLPSSLGTYHGPVPVLVKGPDGSYGASAYADFDFSAKKLSKIVVISPGCNYDETTKIYILTPNGQGLVECPTFTLTGEQAGGGLVKRGAQTLNLYGTQTYSGGTTVESGSLVFSDPTTFPQGTPLSVAKGAVAGLGWVASSVSVLSGSGTVNNTPTLTVTQKLLLSADKMLAAGYEPLKLPSTDVIFAAGATVEISLTDEQKEALKKGRSVQVLTARSVTGAPKLLVNGVEDAEWGLYNNGTALKCGYRHGMMLIVR